MLYGITKLISKCVMLVILALLISNYIFLPIADYFWPRSAVPSALQTLLTIVNRKTELYNIEKQLQEYVSPTGRSALLEAFERIDSLNAECLDLDNEIKSLLDKYPNPNEEAYNVQRRILDDKILAISQNTEIDRLLLLFQIPDEITSATDLHAMNVLDEHFSLLKQYGFYLYGKHKTTDELEQRSENVEQDYQKSTETLDALVNLLEKGDELTADIAKAAAEVEQKVNLGESLEGMKISARVQHFNSESDRLKSETENLVNQNQEILWRTREFIHKAAKKVLKLYNQFQSQLEADGRGDYISHYNNFLIKMIKARENSTSKLQQPRTEL